MKKILFSVFTLFIFAFVFPKPLMAQGTFGCKPATGGNCIVDQSKNYCEEGYGANLSSCADYSSSKGKTPAECAAAEIACKPIGGGGAITPTEGLIPRALTPRLITCPGTNTEGLSTAIGCIPVGSPSNFVGFFLRWGIGIAGAVAFLFILVGGFQILASSGNPEKIKAGQQILVSAISGLILLIFATFILRLIGVDILKLPGIQ